MMRIATVAGITTALLLATAAGCATPGRDRTGAPPAATAAAPAWQRIWTVSGVLGPANAAAQAKDGVGQPVELSAAVARTPYSFPCATAPDYRDVRPRPRATLARHFGPHWRFPAALGERPIAGWVRCPGAGNIGAFAFTDARHGWYFFEDGLILTLR